MTMEEQIAALTAVVKEGQAASAAKFDALQASFDNWKPVVTDLQDQVETLRNRIDRFAPYFEGSTSSPPAADLNTGGRAASHIFGVRSDNTSGPEGHRQQLTTGGNILGVTPGVVPPVTGATAP